MSTATIPTDPAALLSALKAEDIRARLADLEREKSALRVLLRATAARQRAKCRTKAVRNA
jgi:hypothetical protein